MLPTRDVELVDKSAGLYSGNQAVFRSSRREEGASRPKVSATPASRFCYEVLACRGGAAPPSIIVVPLPRLALLLAYRRQPRRLPGGASTSSSPIAGGDTLSFLSLSVRVEVLDKEATRSQLHARAGVPTCWWCFGFSWCQVA